MVYSLVNSLVYKMSKTNKAEGKYLEAYIRKLESRGCWQGILKYKVKNPEYVKPPEKGEPDNRKPNQRHAEIWKQKTKCFNAKTVRTKSQANQALQEWCEAMEIEAAAPEASSVTVPDYVDMFIKRHSAKVEPSTVKSYTTMAKHIRKGFDGVLMSELTSEQVESWLDRMRESGLDPKRNKPLSASTCRKAFNVLSKACEHARKHKLLSSNPCREVDRPPAQKPSPNSLTDDSLRTLQSVFADAEPTPLVVAASLGFYMGLRQGESCALRWKDVDFDENELDVSHSIGRGFGEYATYLKGTKTETSTRRLPMPPQVVSLLKRRYSAMRAELEAAGIRATRAAMAELFVIGYVDGRYVNPDLIVKQWRAFATTLNLMGTQGRLCTFHDTRHTYATKAVANRVDVKTVASYLGHKNVAVTLNIYADADMNAKREAAATVGDAFARL